MSRLRSVCLISLTLLVLSICCNSRVLAATDPIAYWKFDDGSGTTATDSSGNGINGTFTATAPTWTSNVPSAITFTNPYSLDFTGSGDGVTVTWPSERNFDATAPRSFSFWYKPVSNGEGQYSRIISWSNDRLEIAGTNGGPTSHKLAYFDGNWNETNINLNLGTWYHVTFTYDGTTAKFYIGDDLQDEHSLAGRALSGTLRIGNRVQQLDEGINGNIDDVRIYDIALTSNQVTNLSSGANNPDGDPTPTPSPTSAPSTNNPTTASSTTGAPVCTDSAPTLTPDLFQIDSTTTQATLYFTPVKNANRYAIAYGIGENTSQFGTEFNSNHSNGVLSHTINFLSPNTEYSFVVRGGNGCMPGKWGNTLKIKTRSLANQKISHYKNFLARVFSVIPKQVGNTGSSAQTTPDSKNLINNTSCQTYTVKRGDSFWSIADTLLGNATFYKSLMQVNKSNSAIIYPGQKLKIGC